MVTRLALLLLFVGPLGLIAAMFIGGHQMHGIFFLVSALGIAGRAPTVELGTPGRWWGYAAGAVIGVIGLMVLAL